MAVERSFASLRLGRDRGLIKAQLLEVGLLPGPNPLVEVRMEFREQVSDRRGPMKVDGIRQTGMIEHDAETAMQCAFDDGRALLLGGEGGAAAARVVDAGVDWVIRYIALDLVIARVRTESDEGVDGRRSEEQRRNNRTGRTVGVLEIDDRERRRKRRDHMEWRKSGRGERRGYMEWRRERRESVAWRGEWRGSMEWRNGNGGRMVGVCREGCESRRSSWINEALDNRTAWVILNSMNATYPGATERIPAALITSVDGERHGYCRKSEGVERVRREERKRGAQNTEDSPRLCSCVNRPRGRRVDDGRRNGETRDTCH